MTNKISQYRHDPEDEFSLSHNEVSDIEIASTKQIWISTLGGGLNKFDPTNGRFISNHSHDGPPIGQSIRSLYIDSNENLWLGTVGNGLKKLNTKTENKLNKFAGILKGERLIVSSSPWFQTNSGKA